MAFFNEFPHTRNYDDDLGWLIVTVKKLIKLCNGLEEWKKEHEEEYLELKKLYDDILAGRFPEEMIKALREWIEANISDFIADVIKSVFFGLTDAGYFVAYIPDSWDDIKFNTTEYDIFITEFVDYGHLVLSY